jgi:dGTPase
MANRFYNAFDSETFGGGRKRDYRTAFQMDRDRIIHAHAFRKLQSKTQVFLSGEYDFYRTRLTHSMEVAQIGRSICAFLRSRGAPLARISASTAISWRRSAWRTISGIRPSATRASARCRS